jgi:hypothetical protein
MEERLRQATVGRRGRRQERQIVPRVGFIHGVILQNKRPTGREDLLGYM